MFEQTAAAAAAAAPTLLCDDEIQRLENLSTESGMRKQGPGKEVKMQEAEAASLRFEICVTFPVSAGVCRLTLRQRG